MKKKQHSFSYIALQAYINFCRKFWLRNIVDDEMRKVTVIMVSLCEFDLVLSFD